ncbi:MAG: SpoIIE family protein phosphatase, partial [Oligoflexia bacterium]|nr:SpoIIE family protein phosphatase [Oligoflexia bacterium]
MARKDSRTPEQKIKQLEAELAEKNRELLHFRQELQAVNRQLETFIGQLSQEIRLAGLIQRSMVPTEIPHISGFEFAIKFMASANAGSDYFDIFELEDKYRFGMLLSSSSGHGVAALFMSVLLKNTTQIEARKGLAPAEFMKLMHKEIQSGLKGDNATRLFFGIMDRKDMTFTYAKAGDVPAYVYKNSHDKWVELKETQGTLTAQTKVGAKEESIELEPRDRLVIFSHGLRKIVNKNGDSFSEIKLLEDLSDNHRGAGLLEWRNETIFQTQKFMGQKDYPPDFSLRMLCVK